MLEQWRVLQREQAVHTERRALSYYARARAHLRALAGVTNDGSNDAASRPRLEGATDLCRALLRRARLSIFLRPRAGGRQDVPVRRLGLAAPVWARLLADSCSELDHS